MKSRKMSHKFENVDKMVINRQKVEKCYSIREMENVQVEKSKIEYSNK